MAAVVLVVGGLLVSGPRASAVVTTPSAGVTVANFEIDAAHSGYQPDSTLGGALRELWSAPLGGAASYALVVGDDVYTSVGNQVLALDESTGATVWSATVGSDDASLAYGDGTIVAVSYPDVYAFNDASGQLLWHDRGYQLQGPPTVADGEIFGVGPMALSLSTGKLLWASDWALQNNSGTTLAVDGNTAYAVGEAQAIAFNAVTGSEEWHYQMRGGGGGYSPSYADGKLWLGSGAFALDGSTGALTDAALSRYTPAVDPYRVFLQGWPIGSAETISAQAVSGGQQLWTDQQAGQFAVAPVVANGHVLTATTSGVVTMLDEGTGAVAWSANTGAAIPQTLSGGTTGQVTALTVAGDLLLVPTVDGLIAYEGSGPSGCGTAGCAPVIRTGSPTASGLPGDRATGYLVNSAHTGAQHGDPLKPPLREAWTKTLAGPVSYPLIAGGKVYVTAGLYLYAFEQATGRLTWGPIDVGQFANLVYNRDTVFTVTDAGYVGAFNAQTGRQEWASDDLGPGGAFIVDDDDQPPNAAGGNLLTAGEGESSGIIALSEKNGSSQWDSGVADGSGASPVVADGDVFGIYTEGWAVRIHQSPLHYVWADQGDGEGGVTYSPVAYSGRLWSSGAVFSAATGKPAKGGPAADYSPAFAGTQGFFVAGHNLRAANLSGRVQWTFRLPAAILDTSPVAANSVVYVGATNGNLYGLDAATGKMVWKTHLNGPLGSTSPDSEDVAQSNAVGEGILAVPVGDVLHIYR